MLRHRTASKNLQSDFTGDWLMGFTFPGGTSPHGTASFYGSRDHFPTTSQLHQAQNIAAHRWVCTPKPSRERAKDPRLLSLPVTLLISPGSRRDDTFAVLGCTGVIERLSMDATEAAPPCPWGQNRSTHADSTCFLLFSNISKRYLNFSVKKTELAKF